MLIGFGLGQSRAKAVGFAKASRLVTFAEGLGLLDLLDRGLGLLEQRAGRAKFLGGGVGITRTRGRPTFRRKPLPLLDRAIGVSALFHEPESLARVGARLPVERFQRRLTCRESTKSEATDSIRLRRASDWD